MIALLCALMFTYTMSLGAFPALLPEIATSLALSDVELGAVAGAFGFARMIADLPVGLMVARHPRRALALSPVIIAAGVLCLGAGGPLALLVTGRVLMGVGQALAMIGGLTALLRRTATARIGASLNAIELTAMIGMLGGNTLVGALPARLPWNMALLLACSPLAIGFVVTPFLLASLSVDPPPPPGTAPARRAPVRRAWPPARVVLAFAAGATIAMTYSTAEQFVIPLRASHELGLGRTGITRLLMTAQACDVLALLPVGLLADRARRPARVLGGVLLCFAGGSLLIALGDLPLLALGCALYGIGMAGWQLPLGILRSETAPAAIAWRTSVYRVFVDAGMFLGPFLAGALGRRLAMLLPVALAAALAAIGARLLLAPGASWRH